MGPRVRDLWEWWPEVWLFYDREEYEDVVERYFKMQRPGFVLDEGLREYIFALTDGYPGAMHALLEYVAMVSLLSGGRYVYGLMICSFTNPATSIEKHKHLLWTMPGRTWKTTKSFSTSLKTRKLAGLFLLEAGTFSIQTSPTSFCVSCEMEVSSSMRPIRGWITVSERALCKLKRTRFGQWSACFLRHCMLGSPPFPLFSLASIYLTSLDSWNTHTPIQTQPNPKLPNTKLQNNSAKQSFADSASTPSMTPTKHIRQKINPNKSHPDRILPLSPRRSPQYQSPQRLACYRPSGLYSSRSGLGI